MKTRSWKTRQSHGKGHGKSWNFKRDLVLRSRFGGSRTKIGGGGGEGSGKIRTETSADWLSIMHAKDPCACYSFRSQRQKYAKEVLETKKNTSKPTLSDFNRTR